MWNIKTRGDMKNNHDCPVSQPGGPHPAEAEHRDELRLDRSDGLVDLELGDRLRRQEVDPREYQHVIDDQRALPCNAHEAILTDVRRSVSFLNARQSNSLLKGIDLPPNWRVDRDLYYREPVFFIFTGGFR
jgi:hypothetical protein